MLSLWLQSTRIHPSALLLTSSLLDWQSLTSSQASYFYQSLLCLPYWSNLWRRDRQGCALLWAFLQNGIGSYLGFTAIFVITVRSVERWLLISRRSTAVTTHRIFKAYVVICLLPAPFITSRLARSLDGCHHNKLDTAEGIVVFICLLIASVFYFKVLQIIRRHQLQIQATQPNQGFGQAAIDIAKYKKSVIMLFYILALFSVCYLPSAVFLQVMLFYQDFQHTTVVNILTKILSTLYYLSSALNPLLYWWS